jgi:DNA-binding LacI/PurR family transcriptional regulator
MLDAGLMPRIACHDRYVDTNHLDLCRELLSGENRPTAVLVYSERDVSTLMCVAAELGLSVPGDLSVQAFHSGEFWCGGRNVGVVDIPSAELGKLAVAMLMQKIESPNELCAAEAVAYGPVSRDTVAPPKVR